MAGKSSRRSSEGHTKAEANKRHPGSFMPGAPRSTGSHREVPKRFLSVPIAKCTWRHLVGVPQAPRDLHKRAKAPEESLL